MRVLDRDERLQVNPQANVIRSHLNQVIEACASRIQVLPQMGEQLLELLPGVLGNPAAGVGSGDAGQEQQPAAAHDVGKVPLVFKASGRWVDDVLHQATISDN